MFGWTPQQPRSRNFHLQTFFLAEKALKPELWEEACCLAVSGNVGDKVLIGVVLLLGSSLWHLGQWRAVQHHELPLPRLCLFLWFPPTEKQKSFPRYFAINGSWKLIWLFYLAVHIFNYTQHARILQTPWARVLLVCYPALTFCCWISLQKHPFRDFICLNM